MVGDRRKTVMVDKSVQWLILRQALFHWLCFSMTAALLVTILEEVPFGIFRSPSERWQAIRPMIASLFLALLALLPLFIRDWIKLTNRFAGPVARLRQVLRELAKGNSPPPIKFRNGDCWQEVAGELNAALQTLTARKATEESQSASEHPTIVKMA
jgi:hypothetical protein